MINYKEMKLLHTNSKLLHKLIHKHRFFKKIGSLTMSKYTYDAKNVTNLQCSLDEINHVDKACNFNKNKKMVIDCCPQRRNINTDISIMNLLKASRKFE